MSYTAHEWTSGETITAAKMNNIEEGISEAAESGGSGYDVIINTRDRMFSDVSGPNDITVVKLDINALRDKIQAGEPVTGVCCDHYNYDENVDGYTCVDMIPLTKANVFATDGNVEFTDTIYTGHATNLVTVLFRRVRIVFDLTGAPTDVSSVDIVRTLSTT